MLTPKKLINYYRITTKPKHLNTINTHQPVVKMTNVFFQALKQAIKKPLTMFMLGILVALTLNAITDANATTQKPSQENAYANNIYRETPYEGIRDIPSPGNHINQDQIKVYKDKVIITAENIK